MRRVGVTATVHGLRSTFRDWCSETQVAPEVAEQALGHVVTGVEGAYRRTGLFEARRAVMEDWAASLTACLVRGLTPPRAKVRVDLSHSPSKDCSRAWASRPPPPRGPRELVAVTGEGAAPQDEGHRGDQSGQNGQGQSQPDPLLRHQEDEEQREDDHPQPQHHLAVFEERGRHGHGRAP